MLPGIGDGLADDLLVTEMDPVEHAYGKANFARTRVQVGRVMEDVHASAS